MKKLLILAAILFMSCETPTPVIVNVPETPDTPTVETPTIPDETGTMTDPRLSLVSAADAKWIRKPTTARSVSGGIATGDPVAELCTTPAWSYMFYDDGAVIGYEPFPDNVSVMQYAVAITVESHNMEYPDKAWDFINVPPIAPPHPNTSNDPVLGEWQACLCLDSGEIVGGIYTAEFDFNWTSFKTSVPAEVESYNLAHPDNKAHAVWGTDKVI